MRALLSLHRLTVGKPGLASQLIDIYGSAAAVLADFDHRLSPTSEVQAHKFLVVSRSSEHQRQVDADLEWSKLEQCKIIPLGNPSYPSMLANTDSPPLILFTRGSEAALVEKQIAVVGSRRATRNGLSISEKLSSELSASGLVITSGMALGIDAAAHRGALRVGGTTIAVQAAGAGAVYPRRHEKLGRDIVESGCIVTEYPTGTPPLAHYFPQRNRIVTGLAQATLVIEAASRSGSLISARLAMEQGRDVLAVPGSVLSDRSQGCHQLIRDGAKLVSNLTDVLEEFGEYEIIRHRRQVHLSKSEMSVVKVLESGPAHADRLHEHTGIDIPELMALLIALEIKGEIESGGNGYQLCHLP